MPFHLDAGAYSVVGKVRAHNEDSYLSDAELSLYGVADGLGGHNAGEQASQLAVQYLSEQLRGLQREGRELDPQWLLEVFSGANVAILEDADTNPERHGMGTTLTAGVFTGTRLLLGHVGDSRAWRVRDGGVEQLTRDHTVVAEQVRAGLLAATAARDHPMRHILSRCLGVHDAIDVDLMELDVAADDAYVFATDGLVPSIGPEQIGRFVADGPDAATAARRLVNEACELDGQDNITAVIVICRSS